MHLNVWYQAPVRTLSAISTESHSVVEMLAIFLTAESNAYAGPNGLAGRFVAREGRSPNVCSQGSVGKNSEIWTNRGVPRLQS